MTPTRTPTPPVPRAATAWVVFQTVLLAVAAWFGPIDPLTAVLGAVFFAGVTALTAPGDEASVGRMLGSLVALLALVGAATVVLDVFGGPGAFRSAVFGWVAVALAGSLLRVARYRLGRGPLLTYTQTTTARVCGCGDAEGRS